MQRFTKLVWQLDGTNKTNEKLEYLKKYFTETPAADAAWGLFFLAGNNFRRTVSPALMRTAAGEIAGLPPWLVEESYDAVGDLAETAALLIPETESEGSSMPLHELIREKYLPLLEVKEDEKKKSCLKEIWAGLGHEQRYVFNKLVTGGFRIGVSRTLVIRALAEVAEIPPSIMAHRLVGRWDPKEENYKNLFSHDYHDTKEVLAYPFFLASQLDRPFEELGPVSDWQAEWKWDGIRSQVIKRGEEIIVWSRGEDLVTGAFPDIKEIGALLPGGTAVDGEIVAWNKGEPYPFHYLQQRLGRKKVTQKMLETIPAALIAYDLLEFEGKDIREAPLSERREKLEVLVKEAAHPRFLISEILAFKEWKDLEAWKEKARRLKTEGLMLKNVHAPYETGRKRGSWWKWKVDPHVMDAVLIYAQRGHGRRASLYTDYTFGVWKEGELVPVAKAYSGLDDREIARVDAFIRRNTKEKFGPVRTVKPELVFEIAFEAIQPSSRHKSGVAVRFPRISRWRHDKKPEEADTLENLHAIMKEFHA